MARVAKAIGLKTEDEVLLEKSKNFLDLCESEWVVYSTSIRIQFEENRNKARQEMPFADGIKGLRVLCQEEMAKFIRKEDVSKADWRWLLELTLCQIITFNARRGGEPPALTAEECRDAENNKWKTASPCCAKGI